MSNVLVSACYGFMLAAFQYRFAWIWPLMILHALADFATILACEPHGDAVVALTLAVFIGCCGAVLLRFRPAAMHPAVPGPRPGDAAEAANRAGPGAQGQRS